MDKAAIGNIGQEGDYEIKFEGGLFLINLGYKGEQAKLNIGLSLYLIQLLELAAKKTDNKIDDAAVSMIKGLL